MHCADLGTPVSEIARVVRPGGHVVISEARPFSVILGAHARYHAAGGRGYIRNDVHLASDYLTAFQASALDVVGRIDPLWGEREIATFPFAGDFPDMLDAAVKGMPIVIAWELQERT